MQSIGERIEEARKRKGISLREAAEATKIRGDFLSSIEQDKFEFDLPDIYKRGFLKNYARYLKLDPDKILAEFNAQQLSKARGTRKSGAELFGSMDVRTSDEAEEARPPHRPAENEGQSLGRIAPSQRPGPSSREDESDEGEEDAESDKVFYLKAAAIIVGVLTLIVILFGLVQAIMGSDTPDLAADDASPALTAGTDPEDGPESAGQSAAPAEPLRLSASGNVFVIVRQTDGGEELYRGTLSEGDSVDLVKRGPVDVLFTAAENIEILHQGERLRPRGSGTAKITIR